MPIQEIPFDITLVGAGATHTLPVGDPYTVYNIKSSGTVTLTVVNNIVTSGTLLDGLKYMFHYTADVSTASTAGVTIFGEAIPTEYLDNELWIEAYYNGTAWEIVVNPDFSEPAIIPASSIIGGTQNVLDTHHVTPISTANVAGYQLLATLAIPANTITQSGEGFSLKLWGTTTTNPAELKNIKVSTLTGATTIDLFTNSNVEDLIGTFEVNVTMIITNIGTGAVAPTGTLVAIGSSGNTDSKQDGYAYTGYDSTVAQYVQIYAREQTPSGGQITLRGAILTKNLLA